MKKQYTKEFDPIIETPLIEPVEIDTSFEPFGEMTIDDIPLSEIDLSQLQLEADTLSIEPFEENISPIDTFNEMLIDYEAVYGGLSEYDFDGKDITQNPEQLITHLDGFQEHNWSNMDIDDQKEQISGLYDYVNGVLDLDNPPNVEYYYEPQEGDYGGYNSATNTLSINEYMLHDAVETADTVTHELWHAYQHQRAENPQTPKDFQYQIGFENYIRPSDDFDAYQSQLVEAEARAFADQVKGALSHKEGFRT